MRLGLFLCCAFTVLACKREEDAPQQTTTTTTATATASSTATGPTPLVALAQLSDSTSAPTPSLTPTPTQTQTSTPSPTQSQSQTTPAHVASVAVGAVSASGLPSESVKRVVAQNTARYRQCYDAGLRGNPALRGRVVVRMTIDASGSMASAEDAGSDLPDAMVVNCVFGTLGTLTFPQPEAGSATATVPIVFSPPP